MGWAPNEVKTPSKHDHRLRCEIPDKNNDFICDSKTKANKQSVLYPGTVLSLPNKLLSPYCASGLTHLSPVGQSAGELERNKPYKRSTFISGLRTARSRKKLSIIGDGLPLLSTGVQAHLANYFKRAKFFFSFIDSCDQKCAKDFRETMIIGTERHNT